MSSEVPAKRAYAPRMSPQDRREHLLDCALTVVVRDGYDALTIEALAQEAGVSRPVVYDAFGTLEAMHVALLDRTQMRALRQALALLQEVGMPEDVDAWLLHGVTRMIETVQGDPDVWRPVLGITRGAPVFVRDRIEETRDLVRRYLAAAIDAGLKLRGTPGQDADVLSHIVMVTIEEFGRLVLEEPPRYSKERVVAALRGILTAFDAPQA